VIKAVETIWKANGKVEHPRYLEDGCVSKWGYRVGKMAVSIGKIMES
jgi:hypothetical protein